jgi:galactose mutarotase-like enzyme
MIKASKRLAPIEFSNRFLKLQIAPEFGGRIDQISELATGKNWLWHPDDYDATLPRRLTPGASFDRHWTGGWDEIFPNDEACRFQSRDLVDHGELWSQAWRVVDSGPRHVKLAYLLETVPVVAEKLVRLLDDEPRIQVQYCFKNLSRESIPYLFKLHPALAIEEGDEIRLPSCEIEPVELGFSQLIGRASKTQFPFAFSADGTEVRLDRVRPRETELREFFYSSKLERGECGLHNRRTGSTLTFKFDTGQFPYVWAFQSYGGFHGHYVMMLEPCTTKPYNLEAALRAGSCPSLEPGETRELQVEVTITQ